MANVQPHAEPEEVMAYLDGELGLDRAASTGAHLGACDECERFAAELRGISQALLEWQVEPAPERLAQAIRTALEQSRKEGSSTKLPRIGNWFSRHRIGTVALAATACLVVAVVLFSPDNVRPRQAIRVEYAPSAVGFGGGVGSTRGPYSAYVPSRKLSALKESQSYEEADKPMAAAAAPLIIRTAMLNLTVADFDSLRSKVEALVRQHGGYVGEMTISGSGSNRSMSATLRVPATQLDSTLTDLRRLGRVEQESSKAEEVTQRYVDLNARLVNARAGEQRLLELLRTRTGKLSDVLAVEEQLTSVRGDVESMTAELKTLAHQIDYATVSLQAGEIYRETAETAPGSLRVELRNAAVTGWRNLRDDVIALVAGVMGYGPAAIFWIALLFWPARFAWRKMRAAH